MEKGTPLPPNIGEGWQCRYHEKRGSLGGTVTLMPTDTKESLLERALGVMAACPGKCGVYCSVGRLVKRLKNN